MEYDRLADVYDWLVPESLLTPEGSVAVLADVVDALPEGARVLDCAAGTGTLAVGLALRGFEVVATDASAAMVERTRALAGERSVELRAEVRAWEQGWDERFDAVFCVGNSLTHAEDRPAALARMAEALRPGGVLVVTSRNWARVRERGSRVVKEELERDGRHAVIVRWWRIPAGWDERHGLNTTVVLEDGGHTARLVFWPFTPETLDEDLRTAGLRPASSTFTPDCDRYLVTAKPR